MVGRIVLGAAVLLAAGLMAAELHIQSIEAEYGVAPSATSSIFSFELIEDPNVQVGPNREQLLAERAQLASQLGS